MAGRPATPSAWMRSPRRPYDTRQGRPPAVRRPGRSVAASSRERAWSDQWLAQLEVVLCASDGRLRADASLHGAAAVWIGARKRRIAGRSNARLRRHRLRPCRLGCGSVVPADDPWQPRILPHLATDNLGIVHRNVIRALSGVALAVTSVLGLAVPSEAAFPGRNGKIAVSFLNDPSGGVGPARLGIGLLRADRGPAQKRTEVIACTDDRGPPRECLRDYAAPAFSPNGRWIAFDAGRRIAVVRTDGSGRRLLTAAGTDPASPGVVARTASGSCSTPRAVAPPAPSATSTSSRPTARAARSGSCATRRTPPGRFDGLFAFERPSDPISSRSGGSWFRGPTAPTLARSAAAPSGAQTLEGSGLLAGRIAHRLLLRVPGAG